MLLEIRRLLDKGYTNPSMIASILWYLGFKEGRFTDLRKIAEIQYKAYCIEQANKKRQE